MTEQIRSRLGEGYSPAALKAWLLASQLQLARVRAFSARRTIRDTIRCAPARCMRLATSRASWPEGSGGKSGGKEGH